MENKHVGLLVLGISISMVIIIFLFNSTLREFVDSSCTLAHEGESCPMYVTITRQTYLSLSIVGILVILGLFMMFSKPKEKIIVKKVKEKVDVRNKPVDFSKLNNEEKILAKIIDGSNGGLFQSDLIEKSGFGKVKVTRILDKLDSRGFIERKRRGMNNFVMLK